MALKYQFVVPHKMKSGKIYFRNDIIDAKDIIKGIVVEIKNLLNTKRLRILSVDEKGNQRIASSKDVVVEIKRQDEIMKGNGTVEEVEPKRGAGRPKKGK